MIIITSLMLMLHVVISLVSENISGNNVLFIVLSIVTVINMLYLLKGKNLKFLLKTVLVWINTFDLDPADLKRVILITRRIFSFNILIILLLPVILLVLSFIGIDSVIGTSIIQSVLLINGLFVGPVNFLADRSINKRITSTDTKSA